MDRLSIVLEVDTRTGEAAISRVNKGLDAMGAIASRAGQSAGRALGGMVNQLSSLATRAQNFSQRMNGVTIGLGAATAGLTAMAFASIHLASTLESAEIAFSTMTRSASVAHNLIKDFQRFAANTPFEFVGLVEQGKALLAYGFQAQQIIPMLTKVGDAAAALGQEKLPFITRALGQINAKGRVQAQELLQLQEAGINATKYLAEAAGMSVAEMLKKVEAGVVPAKQAIAALLAGMDKDFGGLMAKTATTLQAQLSNLKDAVDQTLAEVGAAIAPTVKQWIAAAQPMLANVKQLVEAFKELPAPVRDTTVALGGLLLVLGPLMAVLPSLVGGLGMVTGAIATTGRAVIGIGTAVPTVATALRTGMTGALIGTEAMLLRAGMAGLALTAAIVAIKGALELKDSIAQVDMFSRAWQTVSRWAHEFIGAPIVAFLTSLGAPIERVTQALRDMGKAFRDAMPQTAAEWLIPAHGAAKRLLGGLDAADRPGLGYMMGQNAANRARLGAPGMSKADLEKYKGQGELSLKQAMDAAAKESADKAETARQAKAIQTAERQTAKEVNAAMAFRLEGMAKIKADLEAERQNYRDAGTYSATVARHLNTIGFLRERNFMIDQAKDAAVASIAPRDGRLEKQYDQYRKNEAEGSGQIWDAYKSGSLGGLDEQKRVLEANKQAQLDQVDAVQAKTVEQHRAQIAQKLAIEKQYMDDVAALDVERIERERIFEIAELKARLDTMVEMKEISAEKAAAVIDARNREAARRAQNVEDAWKRDTAGAERRAAMEQARVVQDHNQKVFDSFKRQAEGVFDALLTKSQSIWSAIGNSLKTALLTAIKDVVTSRIAMTLMQMFSGVRMGGGGFSGGGGIFGSGPVGGNPMILSAMGPMAGLAGLGGMGGGIAPMGGGGGVGGPVSGGGGLFSGLAGMSGLATGLKSFFGIGGSVQLGAGMATTWGAATLGQKAGSVMKSNGAMVAGGLMALDGLRRGGMAGLGETTAGGALIGAHFGPWGAAIGAGIGFIAGLIRLGVKGQVEKTREKVRSLYGLAIDDKMAKQIIDIAKQSYGGNVDMAIRSQEVVSLLELYAQATGKPFGMQNQVRSASMVQSGGTVYQAGGYYNGSSFGLQSSLPSLSAFDRTIAATGSNAGPMAVTLSLDGRSSAAFLQGQTVNAIAGNPTAVSSAAAAGFGSSYGRGEAATSLTSPGTLIR